MNWMKKLERKIGWLKIPNLMRFIIALNAISMVAILLFPGIYMQMLFSPELVLKGQVWRLFTFLMIPPSTNLAFGALMLYFYYIIGDALERTWGAFRFTFYYLCGVLFLLLAGFLTGSPITPALLNLSLFLAFAKEYPNEEFLLFFVFPVKAKVLAYLDWFYLGFMFLFGGLVGKAMASAAIVNYLIFYWKDILDEVRRGKRRSAYRKSARHQVIAADFTYHRCHVCGRTEKSNPELTFRYCNQCAGDFEFCNDHIFDHEHEATPLS